MPGLVATWASSTAVIPMRAATARVGLTMTRAENGLLSFAW
jgi:hypothetical protein